MESTNTILNNSITYGALRYLLRACLYLSKRSSFFHFSFASLSLLFRFSFTSHTRNKQGNTPFSHLPLLLFRILDKVCDDHKVLKPSQQHPRNRLCISTILQTPHFSFAIFVSMKNNIIINNYYYSLSVTYP